MAPGSTPSAAVSASGLTLNGGESSGRSNSLAVNSSSGELRTEDDVFEPLGRAGKVLDERLAKDDQWFSVGDNFGSSTSSDYVLPPNSAWAPLQKKRTVLLPDRLFEEHDLNQSYCSMGLFPEIERSWVTIDHRLLLWDWVDGSSFSTFEDLKDTIVGVGLVTPRPKVFVDSISHLLVLATPTAVTLLGLGYAAPYPGATKEVTFYLTGLSVATEGISFVSVKGTPNGRIFLTSSAEPLKPGGIGGDGCLYEMVYQSSEGWFAKRCSLQNLTTGSLFKAIVPSFLRSFSAIPMKDWIVSIEIDGERGLLYTLLRNGVIEMYQLPSSSPSAPFDGLPIKVAKTGDLLRQAQVICPGSPMLNARNFRIVSLEVISRTQAGNAKLGLVAVTCTGVRLYCTHQRRGYAYYATSAQPSALELCHVRPPPSPNSASLASVGILYGQGSQGSLVPSSQPSIAFNNIIQASFSNGGVLLAANNVSADINILFVAAPDVAVAARAIAEKQTGATTGLASRPFSELTASIEIPGRTWDMAEITAPSLTVATGAFALNELATQLTQSRREWVVLTNAGASVIVRQRPVDTLIDILDAVSMNGGGHGEIGLFFESYGRDQSCAMLLAIAAGNSRLALSDNVSRNHSSGLEVGSRPISATLADQAKILFFEGGGRAVSVDRGGYGSGSQQTPLDSRIIYSGRHEGLAVYFARLVRPIWKQKVARPSAILGTQTSNIPDLVLLSVQRDLAALRTFLEHEDHLFNSAPEGGKQGHFAAAYEIEMNSVNALKLLLTQTVEAISFILLLVDYQITEIVSSLAVQSQQLLASLTYQDLLTSRTGRDLTRSLVSAVINQQIGRQQSVDAISDILQQRCGSFCSADDVLIYKAVEAIRRAKDSFVTQDKIECLRESSKLFMQAAKHLSYERLKEVCTEYAALQYPLGVVDLAIYCAQNWDPSGRALSFWLDGLPPNDSRIEQYTMRKKCNSLVFDTLQATDNALDAALQGSKTQLTYEEADALRSNAYNKALLTRDEFFHSEMYDWYLSRNMTDQLLETRTSYLEQYLIREPTTLEKSDLLWQYYVRTSRYAEAAHVLATLAEDMAFPLSLQKRVEYLSLAAGNAKSLSQTGRSDSVQFLTQVEEKLEVAQVQIEIYRAIEELDNLSSEVKRSWLDRLEERLFAISELYSDFAQPLQLLEIMLLIYHVAEHRDLPMVVATWKAILEQAQQNEGDQPLDLMSAKVIELGRRFHSSDVSFPLTDLIGLLEEYSLKHRGTFLRPGWVPLAFHEAGISWEAIYFVYNDILSAKSPPWHTLSGLSFLASDFTVALEAWLRESGGNSIGYTFPATEVDSSIGKYIMHLGSTEAAKDVTARLKEVQRVIRSRF